jgi:hypothetical protein
MRDRRATVVIYKLLITAVLAAAAGSTGLRSGLTAEATVPLSKAAPSGIAKTNASALKSTPTIPLPPRDIQILMVRTALIALDQANKTNNYSVFQALGAPEIKAQSMEQLSKALSGMRAQNLDLAPTVIAPVVFSPAPKVTPQGVLQLAGVFQTQPLSIKFNLTMRPVGGYWRLAGLSVAPGPAVAVPAVAAIAKLRPSKEAAAAKPKAPIVPPAPAYNADGTPVATTAWKTN